MKGQRRTHGWTKRALAIAGLGLALTVMSSAGVEAASAAAAAAAAAREADYHRRAAADEERRRAAERVQDAPGAGWAGFNAGLNRNRAEWEKFNARPR